MNATESRGMRSVRRIVGRTGLVAIGLASLSIACGAPPTSADEEASDQAMIGDPQNSCGFLAAPLGVRTPVSKLETILAATAAHHDVAMATIDVLPLPVCVKNASSGSTGAGRTALTKEIVAALQLEDLGGAVRFGPTTGGETAFHQMVTTLFADIAERVDDGTLTFTGDAASYWADRVAIARDLVADAPGAPGVHFLEIPLQTEQDECSQQAVARIDLRGTVLDHQVVVLRRTPRC